MLSREHPVSALLGRVIKASEQAAHLVKQLLAYPGKGRFVVEPVDLSGVVEDVCTLVQPAMSKKVTLQLDLEQDLPPVEADRSQMQQVVMNLVLNASEAIGDRAGAISIRTGIKELDERRRNTEPACAELAHGRYLRLEIQDTGPGMDGAIKDKIFDPFFTTKFTGRGLGLAAVSGIVRGHRGAVLVETAPGKGSCFKVLLPAANRSAYASPPTATEPPKEHVQGTGTVLVIDDEEAVRETAKGGLERHGYHVLLAQDGPSAIEIFKAAPDRIGLIVLDLSMPGISGQEVLPELRKIRPDVNIMVSSGYNEEEVRRQFTGVQVTGFIQKPYTVQQLAGKVRQVLGARSGSL